jgi:hypothetical protein
MVECMSMRRAIELCASHQAQFRMLPTILVLVSIVSVRAADEAAQFASLVNSGERSSSCPVKITTCHGAAGSMAPDNFTTANADACCTLCNQVSFILPWDACVHTYR